jgi:predicted RNase H-like HicB family nuclease
MKYRVALLKSDEGYAVWATGLPGCCSQGETEAAALENIADAIREWLAVREEQRVADIDEEVEYREIVVETEIAA